MPDWVLGIIASIVSSGTVAGTILGYMRSNGRNGKNGVKRQEYSDQVRECTERFIGIAKDTTEIKTRTQNIDRRLGKVEGRLENIEGWLKS